MIFLIKYCLIPSLTSFIFYNSSATYLNVFGEQVVCVDMNGRKIPDFIKIEFDVNWARSSRVISPTNPFVT